ncbi:MAG: hypothetical protein U9R25_19300 [Chloroflexota bacterium]|nr:hypothetical protein [Chloroflexota bacterium]
MGNSSRQQPPSTRLTDSSRRRRKDRTLQWALVTALILSLCGLAGLTWISIGGELPDLGSRPSWTPPPHPTALPASDTQAAVSEGRFNIGDGIMNASGSNVNLRRSPGYQKKPAGDVLISVPPGSMGWILEGPSDADGLSWWRLDILGTEGWMAERSSSGLLLLDHAQ